MSKSEAMLIGKCYGGMEGTDKSKKLGIRLHTGPGYSATSTVRQRRKRAGNIAI